MERLIYHVTIDAPREKVWQVLWGEDTYPKWTSVFGEGSRAETDWQEGSKVLFLAASGDGMVSRVVANRPNEFMSFEHLGELRGGVEDTTSDRVKAWAGCLENYWLETVDGKTNLRIETDVEAEWKAHLEEMWPTAVQAIKQLSEA